MLKKKTLPNRLAVLGWFFDIEVKETDEDTLGECFTEEYRIEISAKLSEERAKQTLFHELIHAALSVSGQSFDLSSEKEESIVLALEHALFPYIDKQLLSPQE